MIDGVKFIVFDKLDEIRQLPNLDFIQPASVSTGEVMLKKPPMAEYKGLKITSWQNRIEIAGSIHKFFNNGQHNSNDFSYADLLHALSKLEHELHIDLNNCVLVNLEVGMNLVLEGKPKRVIDSVIIHRGKEFALHTGPKQYYKECSHSQFYIKIYDKGIQYSREQNILRCEIKFRKMEKPNKMGIRNLADLPDIVKLRKLSNELQKVFQDILIGDRNANKEFLSHRDQLLFADGHSAEYWKSLVPESEKYHLGARDREYIRIYKIYERRLSRFKKILNETGADLLHKNLLRMLSQKSDQLLSDFKVKPIMGLATNENRGKMTDKTNTTFDNNLQKTSTKSGENDRQVRLKFKHRNWDTISPKTGENDTLLYSVNTRQSLVMSRTCPVTGLDISMQRKSSRFLCTTGIIFYKNTDPEVWDVLKSRLSERWKYCSEMLQIREIHHSIRNQYFNQKHNARRSIDQIINTPSLFDQHFLIRKDKLRVAGYLSDSL